MVFKQRLASQPIGHGGCNVIHCISMDRDPHQTWGPSTRSDGLVGTLRTQNELLCGIPVLSRCLHPLERWALQGFRPEDAAFFSKSDGMRVLGNASSVPVVTHAFQQVLECFLKPSAFGFPDVPCRIHRSRESDEVERILHRAEMLNLDRSYIAILERLLALSGIV